MALRNHRRGLVYTGVLSILLAAAGWLALGGAPTEARAASRGKDTVRVTALRGMQVFPLYVMKKKGIAKKYHLKIDQINVAGPQALYTVMQTAQFEVGFGGWLSIALMRAKGEPLTNVYSMYGYTNDVLVPDDSPLKSLADLKGKKIGLFGGPNAGTTWLFRLECVRYFGLDPFKESKVQFGAPPLLMGLLEKRQLDAILILDPQIVKMLETGKYRSIGNIGDIWHEKTGEHPMLVAISVNENWAKAHADLLRRFVAAYREALIYLKTHKDIWPKLARSVGIDTAKGAELLRERTAPNLLTIWNHKFIKEQYAYAAQVLKVFGKAGGIPSKIPDGTFSMAYAP